MTIRDRILDHLETARYYADRGDLTTWQRQLDRVEQLRRRLAQACPYGGDHECTWPHKCDLD